MAAKRRGRNGMQELKDLAAKFQLHNRAENKSPKTIEWYEDSISRFCKFVEEWKGKPATLDDLNVEQVQLFIVDLQGRKVKFHNAPNARERKLSPYTINAYVRALRAFSRWLYFSDKTRSWTLERLKPPKLDRDLKDCLSPEELQVLFETFNPECFLGSRNTAMIAVLLDSGLRASELVDLKLQDCDLEVGYLKVKGKGRKERVVGVSDQTLLMVQKYLDYRPDTECPNLFVTFNGTTLSYNAIQNFFKRLRKRLGFEKLHAHLLRHTSATMHLQNGEDLVALQRQMGHTSIAVTQLYVARNYADVKAHKTTSPLKHVKIRRRR